MSQMLTLLHSASENCSTFDSLRDDLAPNARFDHKVRQDWLARVHECGMTPDLAIEIQDTVRAVQGPVLCTCATLGETAIAAGAMRVDQPMMACAAESDGPILLVCTRKSAANPSRRLLLANLKAKGREAEITMMALEQFYPLFAAGRTSSYSASIAAAVIEAVLSRPDFATVVLAQASMYEAAHLLEGLGAEVLAAPELALRALLDLDEPVQDAAFDAPPPYRDNTMTL